ncbi:VIR protein [Plasmodium vivax]|uniref:VIR protein n=1 Tax=Plasmodium vivax TaxID=5855 RepID=A0A1G4ECA3_PLAVI|nr:VIR protein [Plasmodium vivax]
MAKPGASIYITTFDSSKTLNTHTCLDKYEEVVEAVEDKIDQFNKQKYDGFEEWVKLNEHINIKKKDLDECYKRQFLTLHLNRSGKIRGFRDICAKNPRCPNNPAYRAEGPVKLQTKTEDTCGATKDCREKTKPAERQSEPKAKESKLQPGVDTKTPKTGTAEGKKLLQTGPPHAQGEESTQEQLIQQVPPVTNPSDDFAETHVDARESRANHASGKPKQLETQAESSPALEASAGHTDNSSSKNSSAEDSDQKGSSEALGLSSRGHQGNSYGGLSSDSNLAGLHVSGKHAEGQAHDNPGVTTETSDGAALALKAPASEVNGEGSPLIEEPNVAGTEGAIGQSAPVTANANSHNETVGDGGGDANNVIRSSDDNTHLSLSVTRRNSTGHNFSDRLASHAERSDKRSLPKVDSVSLQEVNYTRQGKVHQSEQCKKGNLPSQLEACQNPQLINPYNVHEQQQEQGE